MLALSRKLYDALRDRAAGVGKSPVIIVGNQKSGTSAIAHLLADYAGFSRRVDVPLFWLSRGGMDADIVRGSRSFIEVYRSNRRFFVSDLIKEPSFTFYLDEVRNCFPHASYVAIVRDPRDNIRSILNRWGISGDRKDLTAAELSQRALLPDLWGGSEENYVGRPALKWNVAAKVALEYGDALQVVRYEDFLKDKAECIAHLAMSLGLSQNQRIDHRLDVAYQPRGDSGVSWDAFFGAANLSRIEHLCATYMEVLGYVDTR